MALGVSYNKHLLMGFGRPKLPSARLWCKNAENAKERTQARGVLLTLAPKCGRGATRKLSCSNIPRAIGANLYNLSLTTTTRSQPSAQQAFFSSSSSPSRWHVDLRHAAADFDPESAVVYNDFICHQEHHQLLDDMKHRFQRRRYEAGHWDAVITGFREAEVDLDTHLSPLSREAIQRVHAFLTQRHFDESPPDAHRWLPVHAIDLCAPHHKDTNRGGEGGGQLLPHVDSVRFSGKIVAGLSLASPSVMRLCPATPDQIVRSNQGATDHDDNNNTASIQTAHMEETHVDLFLPPRSLYILSGMSRYFYTHQLLSSLTLFSPSDQEEPMPVLRERRISLIFRDVKNEHHS